MRRQRKPEQEGGAEPGWIGKGAGDLRTVAEPGGPSTYTSEAWQLQLPQTYLGPSGRGVGSEHWQSTVLLKLSEAWQLQLRQT